MVGGKEVSGTYTKPTTGGGGGGGGGTVYDRIPDIVAEMQQIYPYIDSTEKQYIRDVRNGINEMDDQTWVNMSLEWINPFYSHDKDKINISFPGDSLKSQSVEDPSSASSLEELRTLLLPALNARQTSMNIT
jgi:hypothetical protein